MCVSTEAEWTEWFDRDDERGSGDWEKLSDLHAAYPDRLCSSPLDIQVNLFFLHHTQILVCVAHTHLADGKCSQQATGMRAADGSNLVIIMFFWNNMKIHWQVIAQAYVSALVTSLPLKKEHFGRICLFDVLTWLRLEDWSQNEIMMITPQNKNMSRNLFFWQTCLFSQAVQPLVLRSRDGLFNNRFNRFKSQVLSINSRPTSAGHFGKSWCLRVDFH